MQIIRTGEKSTTFEGQEFHVLVMDKCPGCGVAEAHALHFTGDEDAVCQICFTPVAVETPAPTPVPAFEVGQYVTTTKAHPNNVYKIREVGAGWLLLDDRTAMGLSVDTDTATLHAPCGMLYCDACYSVTSRKGGYYATDRATGRTFQL